MGALVILNGNIQILPGNGLSLVSGKGPEGSGVKDVVFTGEMLSVVMRVLFAEKFQHILGHHP